MADEEQQCVFCHIASGKIPAKKVYDDDKVAAVLDINPATPGHILIIPKNHVAIMPQMSDDLIAHLGMVAKQLSHAVIRALKVDGTSVFVANGIAAGQRAPHFLLHVIPRSQNDNVGLNLPIVKVEQKNSDAIFEKLGVAIAKQFGVEPKVKHTPKEPPKAEAKPIPKQEAKEPKSETKDLGGLDEISKFLTGGK
jgi:histidine triad (HIT) family protein